VLGTKLRFRAVLMTSIAFVARLVPLVWAAGASLVARRSVTTPVFVGMIVATGVGLFHPDALRVLGIRTRMDRVAVSAQTQLPIVRGQACSCGVRILRQWLPGGSRRGGRSA
jgi:hypothetical protein